MMRIQQRFFEPPTFFGGFPFGAAPRSEMEDDFFGSRGVYRRAHSPRQAHHQHTQPERYAGEVKGIPDDFWDPVSPEMAAKLRTGNGRDFESRRERKSHVRVIPIEYQGEEYINLSEDEDCMIVPQISENTNNNGKLMRTRRRSFSKPDTQKFVCESPALHKDFGSSERVSDNSSESRNCLRNGKIRQKHDKDCRYDTSVPSCKFDSREEEMQFNELVNFFSDNQVSDSGSERKSTRSSDSSIAPTPSYPAYDMIQKMISKEGRVVDYIRGDGNCFFRALSKVIYGSESSHEELRQAVVDLIEKYPKEFELFVDSGNIHDHIVNMRKVGTWGTQVEIYAAATLLQREIYVLSPDHTGECYRWLLFSPRFSYPEAEVYDRCYITLCHTNGNHYDRIVVETESCNCGIPAPQLSGVKTEVDLTSSEDVPDVV